MLKKITERWQDLVFHLTCRWLWFRYRHLKQTIPCMHPGCEAAGEPCYLPLEDLPAEYYCAEHKDAHGYCWGCGLFWAGCEEFDFSPVKGLCPNCRDEYEADQDGYDPEMDFGDGDPYGPYGDTVMVWDDDESDGGDLEYPDAPN
ncbi:MAG: hypothetical protein M5R40_07205 [Anaerolineae bacterium]|nr:hypothetical protein [Anaerolineae bacterium]